MTQPPAVADILLKIMAQRRQRVADEGQGERQAHREPGAAPALDTVGGEEPLATDNPFVAALRQRSGRAVIAEVKMGSPKLGSLVGSFDPEEQARTYAAHGAAALSVVVEPDFFFGSYELLGRCQRACGLPAIAKDFIVDPVQLQWAKQAGAAAILLIAALYRRDELVDYAHQARRLGLVPLIETHDPADLDKLEGREWELVGVNNRDLRTFEVELDHSIALLPRLPRGAVRVAESGIHGHDDVRRLRSAGFDAFLIGESLLLADDPASQLRELLR